MVLLFFKCTNVKDEETGNSTVVPQKKSVSVGWCEWQDEYHFSLFSAPQK